MQIKYVLNAPANPPGPLRRLIGVVVTVAILGLVLMFSAALLVVVAIVGAIALGYLWWKTRAVRKQMRDLQVQAAQRAAMASNDAVFEGEVIRVVGPTNEKH